MSRLARPILLFNPAIRDHRRSPSDNLGDLIIERAVARELDRIYGDRVRQSIPSHTYPRVRDLAKCVVAKERFFGGTNLLTGRLNSYYQLWKVAPWQQPFIKDVTLLAAGWMYYEPEENPEPESIAFWHNVLSHRRLHSVRDEYSCRRLKSLGIENVINTSCVTLWPFMEPDAPIIPQTKADTCLIMLTDWVADPQRDAPFLRLLEDRYKHIYFWPQGTQDADLYRDLEGRGQIITGGLAGLDRFLSSDIQFDYVGSRLHGGIYCQLHGRRGLITAVDNRAVEIGRDVGLPVVDRNDLDAVRDWIDHPRRFELRLPTEAISRWRNQFAQARLHAA